jgi:hypothetical protein
MFVTILARFDGTELSDGTTVFNDIAPDKYYAAPIKWATNLGLIEGTDPGIFSPEAYITRQEAAVTLGHYFDHRGVIVEGREEEIFDDHFLIEEHARLWIYRMRAMGILNGRGNNMFEPNGLTTRAEAAALFVRIGDVLLN